MKLLLILVLGLVIGGCRGAGRAGERTSDPGSDAREASAEIEAQLEISNARLASDGPGVCAEFTLRNRSGSALAFEFSVVGFSRTGEQLPDARTAWLLLTLAPGAEQSIRTGRLPSGTESWTLQARRPRA